MKRAGAIALGLAVAVAAAAFLAFSGRGPVSTPATPAAHAPNVVVFVSDDQATSTFRRSLMPQTFRWIVDPGTRFQQGLAAPPLCCPDRAGIITGQYPHNHGVFSTAPGYGALSDPASTLPAWLANGGYDTALVGKFLNRYGRFAGTGPAPGFDSWFQLREPESYYGYDASDDGTVRHFGYARRDYSTSVLTRRADAFVGAQSGSSSPFFLLLAYHAPHLDSTSRVPGCEHDSAVPPTARELRRFRGVPFPKTKAFDERNVLDKPENLSRVPPMTPHEKRHRRRQWHCEVAADAALDRSVGTVMRQMRQAGELRNTLVFYVSDNGFLYGEHRVEGKSLPYEPSLRVPYAVRLPRRERTARTPAVTGRLATNQDIAPTILGLAGLPPCTGTGDCRRMDGRSLAGLLERDDARGFRHRKVLVELDAIRARYDAVRTPGHIYVHYKRGSQELYDLRRDPNELRNLVHDPRDARLEARLKTELVRLRHCSGIRGRDPRQDETSYCG